MACVEEARRVGGAMACGLAAWRFMAEAASGRTPVGSPRWGGPEGGVGLGARPPARSREAELGPPVELRVDGGEPPANPRGRPVRARTLAERLQPARDPLSEPLPRGNRPGGVARVGEERAAV